MQFVLLFQRIVGDLRSTPKSELLHCAFPSKKALLNAKFIDTRHISFSAVKLVMSEDNSGLKSM